MMLYSEAIHAILNVCGIEYVHRVTLQSWNPVYETWNAR